MEKSIRLGAVGGPKGREGAARAAGWLDRPLEQARWEAKKIRPRTRNLMIGTTAAYVRYTDDNPVIQKPLAGALTR
jgi:hypothetical protein